MDYLMRIRGELKTVWDGHFADTPTEYKEIFMADDTLQKVLADRGSQYGDFRHQGGLAQELKDRVRSHQDSAGWGRMKPYQREAIDMILHKIARIINGNPDNVDSWQDISGYAECARVRVAQDTGEGDNEPISLERQKAMEEAGIWTGSPPVLWKLLQLGDLVTLTNAPAHKIIGNKRDDFYQVDAIDEESGTFFYSSPRDPPFRWEAKMEWIGARARRLPLPGTR